MKKRNVAILCALRRVEMRKELRKLRFVKRAEFVLTAILAF